MHTSAWPSPSFTEEVPPEIWSNIFDTACLDDGFTAQSLSLVSRHIRAVSQGHRYLTINVSSNRQMIALESQLSQSGIIAERKLKTRFICITLPVDCAEEAYPEEPGIWDPESDSDDSDYQDSEFRLSDILQFPDSESDSDGEGSSTQYDSETEAPELVEEVADLRNDNARGSLQPWVIGAVEDLQDWNHKLVGRLRHQVYGAMRRLLEACSGTLEVLSFYHKSRVPITLDALIPPLPRLLHLSIGMPPGYYYGGYTHFAPADGSARPPLYPSLKILRLLTWPVTLPFDMWTLLLASVPDSSEVTVVSLKRLYRGLCQKQKGSHVWKFVKSNFDEVGLPGLLTGWWLDDVNGGSGIPSEEELR